LSDAGAHHNEAFRVNAQKFIVPCPAIVVQREAIPGAEIAVILGGNGIATQVLPNSPVTR
jgi:hypothetical protein